MAGPSSAPTAAPEPKPEPRQLSAPIRLAARRFTEMVCPPEVRTGHRADRVLRELGLMLSALPPAARKVLAGALILLDQGARLYPPSRGRRFARLDDRVADAYLRALLARHGAVAELVQRLKSVVTMCYYDLAEVQREIGYEPAPYIAAVSRRRLQAYASRSAPPRPRQPGPMRARASRTQARGGRERSPRADRAGRDHR